MDLPRLLLIRQHFPEHRVADIPKTVFEELDREGFAKKLKPGASVAIGVGSRGITNIDRIVKAAVDYWKSRGFQPFLFPAMGSHGAATAEGQAQVLAKYGIKESTMGCPVRSSLDVVPLGATPEGIETFIDQQAFEADGVMLVGRVKWHTDFVGGIESGLFKMMAIGLGKFAGAQRYHTYGYKMGMENVIRAVGRQVLSSGKILGGLAILEDAYHQTGKLAAVPVENMERREEELLALNKTWMGRLPGDEIDILIVDELGKNISGAGMDTKVINRTVYGERNIWDFAPEIHRIYVRGISSLSYNNAVGLGLADMVHSRVARNMDPEPTYINSLTASSPQAARIPVHFDTDRECLERLAPTVGKHDLSQVTYAWVRNTLELAVMAVSENFRPQIEADSSIEILEGNVPLAFASDGSLKNVVEEALLAETGAAH